MSTLTQIADLTDPQQALDVGYAEGSSLRANGAKPALLDQIRDVQYETPHRLQRRRSPHYETWRRGFDAGYLGQDKPPLTSVAGLGNSGRQPT
jgi:hypothetical protein